ncbi:MAG TPA: hypothetical protein VNT60_11155 [Deinococcales bacterium]|nr:hypothetical protein [Deinococcales bacterium]
MALAFLEELPPEWSGPWESGYARHDRAVRRALTAAADRAWGRVLGVLPRYRLDSSLEGGSWRVYRARVELIENEATDEEGVPTGALDGWFVVRVLDGFAVSLAFEEDGFTPRAFVVNGTSECPLEAGALDRVLFSARPVELSRQLSGYRR